MEPVRIQGHSFTARGVAVGLAIGLVLACTNISMGLQSGWVSTMTMPASLMGFGFFKMISKHLKFPFSPVENVLVQTVAGSMGIMPLGCGLVGVVSIRVPPYSVKGCNASSIKPRLMRCIRCRP